jgi:osmotically-inducible protein OsmY
MGRSRDIRQSVSAELDFDPLVNASDVHVANIAGDLTLSGTVPTYPQYAAAAAAAQRVAGVTRVHNHLEVLLGSADYRDDAMLTTAANNALSDAVTVPAGVEATSKDGNITLTGTVRFGSDRRAAAAAVANLFGVRNIHNDIDVVSDADPIDVSLRVQDALDRHALILDDSDVVVDTQYRTVTLAGHVRTWAEHDAVIDAAWMNDGVSIVRDDLLVTG